jgi:hypothetical protein
MLTPKHRPARFSLTQTTPQPHLWHRQRTPEATRISNRLSRRAHARSTILPREAGKGDRA